MYETETTDAVTLFHHFAEIDAEQLTRTVSFYVTLISQQLQIYQM